MKKLLFLINTLEGGGAEKILVDTVNNLDKAKYDVTLQTVINRGPLRKYLNDDVHYKSIINIKNPFLQRIAVYFLNHIIPTKIVHRIFVDEKYDYEIAFLEGIPTKIIGGSTNKKSIKYAWVHIDLYNMFGIEKVHKNIQKHIKCYKRFNKIVCVSENAKEAFIKRFGMFDNLIVKHNALNDVNVREKAGNGIERGARFRIVSVGRLTNQKGYDRLLVAFKKLMDMGEDCELIIVGEGDKRAELESYIQVNDLNERVSLVGFCDNPYKYMQSADLMVFPSRAEGYSTVVTEAVVLGKPVLVTDCAGMREILGNSEYGLIVENDDKALFEGLKELINNDALRKKYAQMAKKRSNDFTIQARLAELEELFVD